MLTELADIARGQADRVAQQTEGLPDDAGPQLAQATATGLLQSFQAMAGQSGGLAGLMGMLGGGGGQQQAPPLQGGVGGMDGVISQVALQIGSRLGVSEGVAKQAALALVPVVMSAIGSRLGGGAPGGPGTPGAPGTQGANGLGGFSLEGLMGSLGSGTNSTDIAGGLGKLLGKLGR